MAEKHILIVEDDADFIIFSKLVLETQGFKVSFAATKMEAIRQIIRLGPDLIILDVMLNKMSDGFDLARKLKNADEYKNIPIFILTSVGDMTGFKLSSQAGDDVWLPVNDYAEKPIEPEELIDRVEKLLSNTYPS